MFDQCGDFTGLGVTTERGLREDDLTVEGHLEAALGGWHERDTGDDRCPSGEEFVRQTDGTRHVVSGDAELNVNVVAGIEHGPDATHRPVEDLRAASRSTGHTGMMAVRAQLFGDERGRVLRAAWHAEEGVLVLSVWDHDECVATVRLDVDDISRLSTFLGESWLEAIRRSVASPTRSGQ